MRAASKRPVNPTRAHSRPVKKGVFLSLGGRSMRPSSSGSTPRARAGRESVTRLIQRIWTGFKIVQPTSVAASMVITSPQLEERRNRTALWMLSKIRRPSRTATTMVAKLSSVSTMSDAPLETSVPVMPMPTPISADLRAGASFTPSPVMETIFPRFCQAATMRLLCSGATRA
ncbi:hypothetical protein SDC9_173571 [bioreactor metagenome]|uniref:Uncharacterized protein n=1 Tax=bioreactor metagenome TaxID=1076179 RepID=A0A645GGT2_9ZZZZ